MSHLSFLRTRLEGEREGCVCFWMCTVTCLLQLVDAYLETVDLYPGNIARDAYFNGHHVFFSPLWSFGFDSSLLSRNGEFINIKERAGLTIVSTKLSSFNN